MNNCFDQECKRTLKEMREFLKKIDGLIYDRYLNVKRNDKYLNKTPIVDAEKMLNVLKKEVKEW